MFRYVMFSGPTHVAHLLRFRTPAPPRQRAPPAPPAPPRHQRHVDIPADGSDGAVAAAGCCFFAHYLPGKGPGKGTCHANIALLLSYSHLRRFACQNLYILGIFDMAIHDDDWGLRTRRLQRSFYGHDQGWNFGRFLVFLGPRRLYSLSGKYYPSIPFSIEPEVPGTQSTRLRPQFHTESLANPWHNNQGI